MIDLKDVLQTGIRAVRQACLVTDAIQKTAAAVALKDDRSPVTTADYSAQVIVNLHLAADTPGFNVISEESAGELEEPGNVVLREAVLGHVREHVPEITADDIGRYLDHSVPGAECSWVLDPVDGTKGFLRGDQYAVALGLLYQDEVVAGVMGCPRYQTGESVEPSLFFASRGQGAWKMDLASGEVQPIEMGEISDVSTLRFAKGVEAGHHNFGVHERIEQALGVNVESLGMDGQGKYAAVASGAAGAYLRIPREGSTRKECIWDHAAGVAIVSEAGGCVTDIDGKPLDFSHGNTLEMNSGIIACPAALHESLVHAAREAREATA